MKIIIFGTTGLVGKQLVQQALHSGHTVKAFGRNVFTEGLPDDSKLELVQGALFDAGQVHKAIRGCDAVLSAIGGDATGVDIARSLGIKNIIAQMDKAGVKRIVGVGSMAILNMDEETMIMDAPEFPTQYIPVSEEHVKAYKYLEASDLEWTFVCPPEIIDASATGNFTTAADYPPAGDKGKINSGDLALFMLKELEKKQFVYQRVGISN